MSKLTGMNRRTLIKGAAAFAAPMGFVRNGWAQGKQIQVGIWGGNQGEFIRKNVLPAFEKEFDCKVLAQQGSTLGQISLLRASKDAPKFTVMFWQSAVGGVTSLTVTVALQLE